MLLTVYEMDSFCSKKFSATGEFQCGLYLDPEKHIFANEYELGYTGEWILPRLHLGQVVGHAGCEIVINTYSTGEISNVKYRLNQKWEKERVVIEHGDP